MIAIMSLDDDVALLVQARFEILQDADRQLGVTGQITCPKCKNGLLKYRIAKDGRMQAVCTTEHCLQFME